MMEAREEVEETSDPQSLRPMLESNRSQQQTVIRLLTDVFPRIQPDATWPKAQKASSEAVDKAVELTVRLTYLRRLEEEIVEKMPAME